MIPRFPSEGSEFEFFATRNDEPMLKDVFTLVYHSTDRSATPKNHPPSHPAPATPTSQPSTHLTRLEPSLLSRPIGLGLGNGPSSRRGGFELRIERDRERRKGNRDKTSSFFFLMLALGIIVVTLGFQADYSSQCSSHLHSMSHTEHLRLGSSRGPRGFPSLSRNS